jgi:hypothetical protein
MAQLENSVSVGPRISPASSRIFLTAFLDQAGPEVKHDVGRVLGAMARRRQHSSTHGSPILRQAQHWRRKRSQSGALAGLWPPAIIGLGFLLTLAWSGILLSLFVRTVLALV